MESDKEPGYGKRELQGGGKKVSRSASRPSKDSRTRIERGLGKAIIPR